MINIDKVDLKEIHLNLKEPFRISSGITYTRRILLLKLWDKSGASTWSECVAGEHPYYSPETIDTAWLILEKNLIPLIHKKTFQHPSEIALLMQNTYKGHPMAKAAIEMGAWGIFSLHKGLPLSRCLGGTQNNIPTGISLGIQDTPETLVRKVKAAHAEGYHKIKVKIKPGFDIDYLSAVRHEMGDTISLMADANNAYTLKDLHILKEIDKYNLLMLEQPLAYDDVYQHQYVQKALKTPVCLDESIGSKNRVLEMIAFKSGQIVNIKPGRVGGLSEAIEIHNLCQKNNIPVWCGGMLESGIGRAYNIALASLPNFTIPGDLSPSNRYWKQDIIFPEWTMDKKGLMKVPNKLPGLGINVNELEIDKISKRKNSY